MSTFEMFQIGIDEEEKEVLIPLIHLLIAGATGTGKTEGIRKFIAALQEIVPDLKVLIFDAKSTGRDWEGFGKDVKPYVKMSTDTRFLRDLIETSEERKIDFYLYELDNATKDAKTWYDVLENLKKRHAYFKQRKHSLKEEKLGVLIIYMKALIKGYESMETSDKFDLSAPITVVPINRAEDAFQQLVVYTYHKEIRRRRIKHILVVHDEMHKFAPSKRGTGCRRIVEEFFQEGRAAGNFGVASDQEIVGISSTVRSQCWTWILGMQPDERKAKRVVDHLPAKVGTSEDVMTLGVGWFFGVIRTPSKTEVRKFYLIPEGISIETAHKLVRGEMKVEQVMKQLAQIRKGEKKEDEDLAYKAAWEAAKIELKKLKNDMAALKKEIKTLKETWVSPEKFTDMRTDVFNEVHAEVSKELEEAKKVREENKGLKEELAAAREDLATFDRLREVLGSILLPMKAEAMVQVDTSLSKIPQVDEAKILTIVDSRVQQLIGKKEKIEVVTVDASEKIRELVKNAAVSPLVAAFQGLSDVLKKAARFMVETKECSVGQLNEHLYQKTGRPSGVFYKNIVKPLKELGAVSKETGTLTWILRNTVDGRLHFLSEDEREQIYTYLVSLLL